MKYFLISIVVVCCLSCTKEMVYQHQLLNIKGKITVKDKNTGEPINNAIVVIIGIGSNNYSFYSLSDGIANIFIPVTTINASSVSQFLQLIDIGVDHNDYYSNTFYGHHISYDKIDSETLGNKKTHYYSGNFVYTILFRKKHYCAEKLNNFKFFSNNHLIFYLNNKKSIYETWNI